MIKKQGSKWILYSKDGSKKLGTFDNKKDAVKREGQIQYFKNQNEEGGAGEWGTDKLRKKYQKDTPGQSVTEEPTMNTSAIPDPAKTSMGPRFSPIHVTDRRKKKTQVLLKRFRKHFEDAGS